MAERKKVKQINPKQRVKYKPHVNSVKTNVAKGGSHSKADIKKTVKTPASKPIKMAPEKHKNAVNKTAEIKNTVAQPKRYVSNTPKTIPNTSKRPYKPATNKPPVSKKTLGNKLKQQRKRLVYYIITVLIVGFVLSFCAASPTGPIERITNSIALWGGGDNPAKFNGANVVSAKTDNEKVFVLSDTHLDCFAKNGNQFLSYQHNFSSPVLEVSKERSLLYNRESTSFIVANNSHKIFEKNLEFSIYTADISDAGNIAFATKSSGYAAQVQVFSKKMKQVFSWYLVDGLISDITLSNNGQYLAISVLKVSGGEFNSVVHCFKIDSEEPLFTLERKGEAIVSLETVSKRMFSYVSQQGISFVDFKKGTIKNIADYDSMPTFFKVDNKGALAAFGNTSNVNIVHFNKKGDIDFEFDYNGLIDDISYSDGVVNIIRSNSIFSYDITGKEIKTVSTPQKPHYILSVDKKAFVVDNLNLTAY